MKINVRFLENKQTFNTGMGELSMVTDGGYDVAYDAGYQEGTKTAQPLLNAFVTQSLTEFVTDADIPELRNTLFSGFTKLQRVKVDSVTYVRTECFNNCVMLPEVNFPNAQNVTTRSFNYCTALRKADFGKLDNMYGANTFGNCTSLIALIIRNTKRVCTLQTASALANTPIENGTGFIYVPKGLLEKYKTANNWVNHASQFRALEDYTVDGTVTGALDENKI